MSKNFHSEDQKNSKFYNLQYLPKLFEKLRTFIEYNSITK